MDKEKIRGKTGEYVNESGFIIPKNVFSDFFSQLIKLAGFGLSGMFILSGKKAGRRAVEHMKGILGEQLDLEDIKECIIAYFEEAKQCEFEKFDLTDSMASIEVKHSVFAEGIKSRRPTCLPLGGTIAGMLEGFLGSSWEPKEVQCIAQGYDSCIFEIKNKNRKKF